MKNDKIVESFNAIQANDEVKDRIFNLAMQKQQKKHTIFKPAVALVAAAAVICLMVFGGKLIPAQDINMQDINMFAIKAYAMEQQPDGTIELREVDLVNEKPYWSSYNDGKVFYVNANLKCEGENIKSVEFFTDNGFFAKQYLKIENGKIITEAGVPASYYKASGDTDYTLARYGNSFDIIGNSFTLERNAINDDFLLFVGVEVSDWRESPSQITVRAVATFNDGKTQEQTIILDLTTGWGIFGTAIMPPGELERIRAEAIRFEELVHSIPLEQCEVVPGSEVILTYGDTFEYTVKNGSGNIMSLDGTAMWPITEDSMNPANDWSLKRDGFPGLFDENGVMRFGSGIPYYDSWKEYSGSDGYISVIENNGNGTFTGKTYKVPGWLILEHMK